MNQQEQSTKRAAIFQDTINGTNDPTPWPVTMWASSGDTIWTAGTARTAGEDSVGMCVCSIESGPCERVDVFHVSGRFWSTSACGEKRTPARPAWTSFPS